MKINERAKAVENATQAKMILAEVGGHDYRFASKNTVNRVTRLCTAVIRKAEKSK